MGLLAAQNATLEEGERLLEQGELNRAAAVFEEATRAEPENSAAWAGLAKAHDRTGNPLTAVDAYNRSLTIDPNQPQTWSCLAL